MWQARKMSTQGAVVVPWGCTYMVPNFVVST
ncbi:hypothetical protein Rmet_6506 [Cupriavidus metallidurans CH34]|uniref:Uncharacterized protein n=1 Tax=Cupriavidus metallidurans (strain ATCC 43123 / DSM 2839 / NBRC 102507 / CH34) TaxID=266264 RepID=D3DXU4_CUPMC|nr:hypothetical protein Rmet_6506 [Cupriavidus metallidurans CH34]